MMKKILLFVAVMSFLIPQIAAAQKPTGPKVDEYGDVIEAVQNHAPSAAEPIPTVTTINKQAGAIQEKTEAPQKKGRLPGKNTAPAPEPEQVSAAASPIYSGITAADREKRWRVGLLAPGIGVAGNDVGLLMTAGIEGEYFFYEKLSAGLRIEAYTKFKDPTILGITPQARYIFDFDRFPRWALYVQAGFGVALYHAGGTHAAADIAIPGAGFWWQWTDKWSVGADATLHTFVKSDAALGFKFSPAVRYLF